MQSYYNYVVTFPHQKFTFDHVHLLSDVTTFLFGWVHFPFHFVKEIFEGCFSFYTIHIISFVILSIRILSIRILFIRILSICILFIRILFMRILFIRILFIRIFFIRILFCIRILSICILFYFSVAYFLFV